MTAAGLPQPPGPPELVHYASGVGVEVFPLEDIGMADGVAEQSS